MNDSLNQAAQRVRNNMTLSPLYFLATVNTALFVVRGRLCTLGIDNGVAGCHVSRVFYDAADSTHPRPLPRYPVDSIADRDRIRSFPVRILFGQHPPLGTVLVEIEDRVNNVAFIVNRLCPSPILAIEMMRNEQPLGIC